MSKKVEVNIVMNEDGSMNINSNTTGAHLIGVMRLAEAAIIKDLTGPDKNSKSMAKKESENVGGDKVKPGMAVVPQDGPVAEEKLANQKDAE